MNWGISDNGIVQLTDLLPLDVLYSDSHNPGTIGDTWKKHHDSFSDYIKKSFDPKRILEIGASSGLLVSRFLNTDFDFTWDIVEPSEQNYSDKRINHYRELFENFDPPHLYDTVIHSHLFEHVYNPIVFLLKVNKVLKDGGNQFVSVPNLPHFLANGYSNALNFEHTFFYDLDTLNIIFESLLKWFAPILVFTADEIYTLVNKNRENIHENHFVQIPNSWQNDDLDAKWSKLFKIKQQANIAIEEKRSNKEIGSSLEAEIKIITSNENFKLLENLDLAEYFITSKAEKIKSENKNELKIEVKKTTGTKCSRCWKILEKNCSRCEEAIL